MTTPAYRVLDLDARTRDFFRSAGIASGMRVLDIGTGGGFVARILAELVGPSGQVVAVDQNEQALEMAARTTRDAAAPVRFVRADILDLPADLRGFDAAVGRRVLMYVADPRSALGTIADAVRPGGTIAFEEVELSMTPLSHGSLPLHDQVYQWLGRMLDSENVHRDMGMRLAPLMESIDLTVTAATAEAVVETSTLHYDIGWRLRHVKPRLLAAGVDESTIGSLDDIDDRLVAERRDNGATFIGQIAFRVAATV